MPSKSKKQAQTMTAACKSASFRKKVKIPKKVACDFHKADKGKFHESDQLNELKELIDVSHYGGWITPDNEIEYVEFQGHVEHLNKKHHIDSRAAAAKAGFVRFETHRDELRMDGTEGALLRSSRIWKPTAYNASEVGIDVREDDTGRYMQDRWFYAPNIKRETELFLLELKKKSKMDEAQQLNELKEYIIPEGHYGGWISPEREVFYVDRFQHEDWIRANHGLGSYSAAFRANWVRFETDIYPTSFSIAGSYEGVKHALPIFWPTLLKANRTFADLDHGGNGSNAHAIFDMPDDKQIARNFFLTGKLQPAQPQESLEESADLEQYGGWISPKGKIHYVDFEGHGDWARNYLETRVDYVTAPFTQMFKRGWVRYISKIPFKGEGPYAEPDDFWIEGRARDLNRLKKVWFPMLKNYEKVIVDMYKEKPKTTISRSYELPMDRSRLRKDISESVTQEEILSQKTKTFLDSILDKPGKTGLNNSKYSVSVYKHEVIGEEQNGKMIWSEKVVPVYTKKNLSYNNAMRCEAAFENKTNSLNKQISETPGWSEYFVRIEENKIVESMGGSSTFMKIGRHLIEMQPEWVEGEGQKHPKWEVFVDGRGIGSVEQFSSGFTIEGSEEHANSIEEAVAALMKEKMKRLMVGKKSRHESDRDFHANMRRNQADM